MRTENQSCLEHLQTYSWNSASKLSVVSPEYGADVNDLERVDINSILGAAKIMPKKSDTRNNYHTENRDDK